MGQGNGSFGPRIQLETPGFPYDVASGDLNGDGFADLVTTNEDNYSAFTSDSISIFLGQANGLSQSPQNISTSSWEYGLTVGDYNGDGNLDVATEIVRWGDGSGGLSGSTSIPIFNNSTCTETGDFDGDGFFDDIASIDTIFSTTVSLVAGQNGSFSSLGSFSVPERTPYCATAMADFNGDGISDIVVTHVDTPNGIDFVSVFLSQVKDDVLLGDFTGDGVVNLLDIEQFVSVLISGGSDPRGDFDGDGLVTPADIKSFVEAIIGS